MIEKLSETVTMITVEDPTDELFEARYPIPEGVTYNTYVIKDRKTAVLDTMDAKVTGQWKKELAEVLGDVSPDYLVVHHMEPDHAANIMTFIETYPGARIVASAKAQKMMDQFFGRDTAPLCDIVAEGDVLDLGEHRLAFVEAAFVHWPEVLFSYESKEKILFSADGFGRFGPADPKFDWLSGARRYYLNIVGKFGNNVQKVLKKASGLEISKICPLHGPVLDGGLEKYIGYYDTWSSYRPETEGVAVIYCSFYGNTAKAAEYVCELLASRGAEYQTVDLVRQDVSYGLEAAFRFDKCIFAAPSYEGGLAPQMFALLHDLAGKKFQNRKAAVIENGSFGPTAGKVMLKCLEEMQDIVVVGDRVTILSSMTEENKKQIADMVDNLLKA